MSNQNSTSASVFQQNIVQAMTNVVLDNTASCNTASNISQIIQVTAGGDIVISNVELNGSSYINSECLAQVENDGTFLDKIMNAIETEVENETSQSSGLVLNLNQTQTEVISEAMTQIQQNFKFSNVMNCVASQQAMQSIIANAGGNATITNVSITMDSKLISNCMLTGSNVLQAMNDISSTLEAASANSTSQGCLPGSDITQILLIIGGIILLGLFLRLILARGNNNNSGGK